MIGSRRLSSGRIRYPLIRLVFSCPFSMNIYDLYFVRRDESPCKVHGGAQELEYSRTSFLHLFFSHSSTIIVICDINPPTQQIDLPAIDLSRFYGASTHRARV